jgi:hypothetical protein
MQEILDAIDAGAGAATLKLYTGPRPATGAAISGETLLGTMTFTDPAGTVTTGVLTFDTIAGETNAPDNGVVAWARINDSNGAFVVDLDVGITGSGADIEINNINIVAGGTIDDIGAQTFTEGGV